MSCCETSAASNVGTSPQCCACGVTGSPVEVVTVKALLNARGLRKGPAVAPRFCATADCPLVYYDTSSGRIWDEQDLTVRVHAKHPGDVEVPICYCFDVTPATIEGEIASSGKTAARLRVAEEVKAGRCACEVKNPKGGCCLGDLLRAERQVLAPNQNALTLSVSSSIDQQRPGGDE